MSETVSWTGYADDRDVRHEAILSKKRFDRLWIKFKKCKSQEKFYFEFVNPHKFREEQIPYRNKSRTRKIVSPK